MASNTVTVSDDRMEMTISSPNGQRATLRSARPSGFTPSDVTTASSYRFHAIDPHQINRTWCHTLGRRNIYVHLNIGPPTWWLPRIGLGHRVMVGWLRALLALSWDDPSPGGNNVNDERARIKAQATGQTGWGAVADASIHQRSMELLPGRRRNRRTCHCGCGGKQSHGGYANGVAMTGGCEWSMRRWVKHGYQQHSATTGAQ